MSTTLLITHQVDDVDHWLASPRRSEFFGPMGIAVTTFVNPDGGTLVGLVLDVPDMAAFEAAMASPEAADAMAHDGVHPDTLTILVAS